MVVFHRRNHHHGVLLDRRDRCERETLFLARQTDLVLHRERHALGEVSSALKHVAVRQDGTLLWRLAVTLGEGDRKRSLLADRLLHRRHRVRLGRVDEDLAEWDDTFFVLSGRDDRVQVTEALWSERFLTLAVCCKFGEETGDDRRLVAPANLWLVKDAAGLGVLQDVLDLFRRRDLWVDHGKRQAGLGRRQVRHVVLGVVWEPHREHIARLELEAVEAVGEVLHVAVELLETPSQVLLDGAEGFLVRQTLDGFVQGATDGAGSTHGHQTLCLAAGHARESLDAQHSQHSHSSPLGFRRCDLPLFIATNRRGRGNVRWTTSTHHMVWWTLFAYTNRSFGAICTWSKMLVPLRVDGATNEWCIVEFQGEMVPNDGAEMADVDIGGLWYDGGVPTMRIGNHIVTGKVAKLPKPFAILEKHGETTEPMSDDDGDSSSTETETPVEYNVVGIARTRVIFAARPKPVLT